MSDDRKKTTIPITDEMKSMLGGILPESFGWTDEQWAEHDAKVAATREEQRRVVEASPRGPIDLEKLGWPKRALVVAEKAPRLGSAVRFLLHHRFGGEKAKTIVILSGPAGCGKTVAAAMWAAERADRGEPTTFVRASDFAASSRYGDVRDRWKTATALVVDDLGVEYLDEKGSFLVDLDDLLDLYYSTMKPIVITTNSTLEMLGQRYGSRVYDRLRESGKFYSISEPSMRGARE